MRDYVAIYYTRCDCEWETDYCSENHRQSLHIPTEALFELEEAYGR